MDKSIAHTAMAFKEIRLKEGLSLRGMARRIGVSASTIHRIENEETLADTLTLVKMSREFNCSCDYLLGLCEQGGKE